MSVVKINAIEVPEGAGPELEQRFAARAGAVENSPGFEAFQLLRPTEGESRYFVMTWWESEEAFQGWMNSAGLRQGPRVGRRVGRGRRRGVRRPPGRGPGGRPSRWGRPGGGHPGGEGGPAPVATGSSLLSFEVVESITAPGA